MIKKTPSAMAGSSPFEVLRVIVGGGSYGGGMSESPANKFVSFLVFIAAPFAMGAFFLAWRRRSSIH